MLSRIARPARGPDRVPGGTDEPEVRLTRPREARQTSPRLSKGGRCTSQGTELRPAVQARLTREAGPPHRLETRAVSEGSGGKDGGARGNAAALLIVARGAGVRHRRGLQGMGSQGYRHSWVRESQALSGLDKLFPEGPVLGASRTLAMLVGRDARCAVLVFEPCFPASKQTSKLSSKQASKQAIKQVSKKAS